MRYPKLPPPVRWCAGIALIALALAGLASHADDFSAPLPLSTAAPDPAIRERILAFEAGTARWSSSPLSFTGPDGRPIYLFTAPCCDQFNPLYDAEGRFICAPTGGFAGSGDGQCPAWVRDEKLWRKLRMPAPRGEQPWPPRPAG